MKKYEDILLVEIIKRPHMTSGDKLYKMVFKEEIDADESMGGFNYNQAGALAQTQTLNSATGWVQNAEIESKSVFEHQIKTRREKAINKNTHKRSN